MKQKSIELWPRVLYCGRLLFYVFSLFRAYVNVLHFYVFLFF